MLLSASHNDVIRVHLPFSEGAPEETRLTQVHLPFLECALYGFMASLVVAGAAIAFVRRGAPVSLDRSAWLIGLASGSLGALAYNITCPIDSLMHVGIWHVLPVFIAAVFWRYAAPPLIRW